jgi:hypothetical protein
MGDKNTGRLENPKTGTPTLAISKETLPVCLPRRGKTKMTGFLLACSSYFSFYLQGFYIQGKIVKPVRLKEGINELNPLTEVCM